MTDASTASASATPPSGSVDVTLPQASWFWRRWFCWVIAAALMVSLFVAIAHGQPAFAWPIAALLGLDMMFYVGGATATDMVHLIQSSGIIRAAQSASAAVASVADTVSDVAGRVLPAAGPAATGARNDLAS